MECHEKIKKLRIDNGMSQKDLAQKLGVSQNAVYNWENGKRAIKGDVLQQIADVFNVRRVDLLDDEVWDLADHKYSITDTIMQIFSSKARARDEQIDINDDVLMEELAKEEKERDAHREQLLKEYEAYKKTEEYKKRQTIISAYYNVNKEGKDKIYEYAVDIAENPKYRLDPDD